MNVLVVEYDLDISYLFKNVLETKNYEVEIKNSAADTLFGALLTHYDDPQRVLKIPFLILYKLLHEVVYNSLLISIREELQKKLI